MYGRHNLQFARQQTATGNRTQHLRVHKKHEFYIPGPSAMSLYPQPALYTFALSGFPPSYFLIGVDVNT
jgi:hypothetical protein